MSCDTLVIRRFCTFPRKSEYWSFNVIEPFGVRVFAHPQGSRYDLCGRKRGNARAFSSPYGSAGTAGHLRTGANRTAGAAQEGRLAVDTEQAAVRQCCKMGREMSTARAGSLGSLLRGLAETPPGATCSAGTRGRKGRGFVMVGGSRFWRHQLGTAAG